MTEFVGCYNGAPVYADLGLPDPPPASISLCPQAWRYRCLMEAAPDMARSAAAVAMEWRRRQDKLYKWERDHLVTHYPPYQDLILAP